MKYITPFLLIFAALVLLILIGPIGILYAIVAAFYKQRVWIDTPRILGTNARIAAVGLDILGNYLCTQMFNDMLIMPGAAVKFGSRGYTVSEVLGYSQVAGTLSRDYGVWLVKMLDKVEKDHCLKAIGMR